MSKSGPDVFFRMKPVNTYTWSGDERVYMYRGMMAMRHTRAALLGLALLAPASAFARAIPRVGCEACRLSMSSASTASPIRVCSPGPELLERPRWRPPAAYVPENETRSREIREVYRLTGMLERLCNIIISADDVALAEREATKIGPVFMDARGNMTRQVVLLRQETRELMLEYGIEPRPLRRKWQLHRRTSE